MRDLALFVLIAVGLGGCAANMPPSESQWLDQSQTLRITVNSVPAGAVLYGMSGATAGTRTGVTPLALVYTADHSTGSVVCRNCGGSSAETLTEYTAGEGPLAIATGACSLHFRAVVAMDGYQAYTIDNLLAAHDAHLFGDTGDCWTDVVGKSYEFTAILQRSVASGQQQQQQQQTVVIPGASVQLGSVNVICNVDGAEIWLDGAFVGNTPATLKLPEGMHIVEVRKTGYATFRRELRLIAQSDLTLQANLVRQ
jgi:hypothetical protein